MKLACFLLLLLAKIREVAQKWRRSSSEWRFASWDFFWFSFTLVLFQATVMSQTLEALKIKSKFSFPLANAAEPNSSGCPRIYFEESLDPPLDSQEKKIVCGEIEDTKFQEWRRPPLAHIQFHLRAMLQERGYHFPVFSADAQKDILIVKPNKKTIVQKITVTATQSNSPELDVRKCWDVYGKPLNKKALSTVENWMRYEIGILGYPCPIIVTRGDAESSSIVVQVTPGQKKVFPEVIEEDLRGLKPGVLKRYYPFRSGDPFNAEKITLAQSRISGSQVVTSVFINPQCSRSRDPASLSDSSDLAERFSLVQKINLGEPRLLSLGIGVNTESGLLGRVSWQHSRINSLGSILRLSTRASFREQAFNANMDWYMSERFRRFYLRPETRLRRSSERFQTFISGETRVLPALTYDDRQFQIQLRSGPSFTRIVQPSGISRINSSYASLYSFTDITSHDYELYQADPRQGYRVALSSEVTRKGMISNFDAQDFSLDGHILWNGGGMVPPRWVLGLRGILSTTLTSEPLGRGSKLPPNFRHYLGGSRSLRGFGRNEIPADEDGALTTIYWGTEFRFAFPQFPILQGLAFIDLGVFGKKPLEFELPALFSPGLGVRLKLPFGTIRGTAAHGYLLGPLRPDQEKLSHWQFFLALGEEF